jgi:hypothetical protein
MVTIEFKDPAVSVAVDDYVRSRKQDGRPISVREALQALRAARNKCYASDRDLAEMIAAMAIGQGQDVTFDWTGTED